MPAPIRGEIYLSPSRLLPIWARNLLGALGFSVFTAGVWSRDFAMPREARPVVAYKVF